MPDGSSSDAPVMSPGPSNLSRRVSGFGSPASLASRGPSAGSFGPPGGGAVPTGYSPGSAKLRDIKVLARRHINRARRLARPVLPPVSSRYGEVPTAPPAGAGVGAALLDDEAPADVPAAAPAPEAGAWVATVPELLGWLDELDELELVLPLGWLGGLLTLMVGPLGELGAVVEVVVG